MGASGWSYVVAYQPDLDEALDALRDRVFAEGDYWWAGGEDVPNAASDYPDRPATMKELFDDEAVQESGTHSILDVYRVLNEGETPDFGTVEPVSAAEARRLTGTERLTREHLGVLKGIETRSWFGRCAVLHDAQGAPQEIYFWGFSGD
ncbi:hypothetical protein FHG89_07655 [Micromonospora orduensis]|uniref:Uncharacterized protein n=1 Tax=Micromonospora orduensis TaxID=1420891 RepID=A0A5C4QWD9_9ACTN|nr:hypothetical protein [Micromonospora orduensis]TNH30385.1 hypothetical protein FHG89_07655 [Micromonospora orduensis]